MPETPKPAANRSIDSTRAGTRDVGLGDVSPRNADTGDAGMPTPEHPSLPKIVPFTDLARCGEEIWISHQGQLYRLQSTKAGKLILTK